MAKVYYSALVNEVKGKLGDSIYSKAGKVRYIKTAPVSVAQPRTFRQVQIRNNFCQVSKMWNSIPASYKDLWQHRALDFSFPFFGQQMFLRCNLNLLNASHSGLVIREHPPAFPSTPEFPKNFCVTRISPSALCLSWSSPLTSVAYITAHFRLHKSFCLSHSSYGLCPTVGYRPSYRFIETVQSNSGHIVFNHDWPTNTRLFFRLRSLDSWGRLSPNTHSIMINSD